MGLFASRQNMGVEEVDVTSNNHAYKYPPKSGHYFGTHFIMGGERFETPHPELYLFGINSDLNFLGSHPVPFPYPAPPASEPTKTIKSLINIRKETLKFVKAPEDAACDQLAETNQELSEFNIEFSFDTDCRCAITILYFCTEEITPNGVIYTPRDPTMNSETFHYKRGANQMFSQPTHNFDPSQFSQADLNYCYVREVFPVVIYCVSEEGEEPRQAHITTAVVEKCADGGHLVKPLKQKQFIDGLCYLLQEIYGIENKSMEHAKQSGDEETDDSGAECVICMSDLRDTLILPCRHLCLCNSCADHLRYQANNCPICRAPFRALLQIRALQKTHAANSPRPPAAQAPSHEGSGDMVPFGYEEVSLIEALNGPLLHQPANDLSLTAASESSLRSNVRAVRAVEALNRPLLESVTSTDGLTEDSTTQTERPRSPRETMSAGSASAEIAMTVIKEESIGRRRSRTPSREKVAPRGSSAEVKAETKSLLEGEGDEAAPTEHQSLSVSTPESLHLCDRSLAVVPVTPEVDDKNETNTDESTSLRQEDAEPEARDEEMGSTPVKALSLPGTPLSIASHVSQASNRSSRDSFSSTSSTRLLLPSVPAAGTMPAVEDIADVANED